MEKHAFRRSFICVSLIVLFSCRLAAQDGIFNSQTGEELSEAEIQAALPDSFDLFDSHEPMELEIVSDFRQLIKRKFKTEYQPAALLYRPDANTLIRREIKVKARGNSRREICYFPPLKLNFDKSKFRYENLRELDKIKMVSYCQKGKAYEAYHMKEYLCYRILNILTPNSFQVRLIKMRYTDTGKKKNNTFDSFAFLIETVKRLEKRLAITELVEVKVLDKYAEQEQMDLVAVFQFMIANYDWSVPGLHNIKLFKYNEKQRLPFAVPYDFDYCGLVNANYAIPPEELAIKSVTERLFRGYCRSKAEYERTFERFRQKKEAIYSLIGDFPYLEQRDKKEMLAFLDEFYRIIGNEREVQYFFLDNCRELGKG